MSIDTSTESVHVAIEVPGQCFVDTLAGGAQASASLLPGLTQLLGQAGLGWHDVSAIAVGVGPGAFTGLRTACAVAQGLALGLGIAVLPLDTLMAVAESARLSDPSLQAWLCHQDSTDSGAAQPPTHVLWVLQDARMQEVYAAAYAWHPAQGWVVQHAPALWSLDHARARIESGDITHAAGSALLAHATQLVGLRAAWAQAVPGGQALANLARRAWQTGATVDAARALPVYVRDKVAQTTQERRQAKQAAA